MSSTNKNIADETPTPFNEEGIQFAWDSTSLGTLKECPRKYDLSIVQGWRPKRKSVHLSFGTHIHSAVERLKTYAQSNIPDEEALEAVVYLALEESRGMEPHGNKSRETLISSIIDYADHFNAMDATPTMALTDGTPAVELSFRIPLKIDERRALIPAVTFCGHIDRIVDIGGFPYVTDIKTTRNTLGDNKSTTKFFQGFNPDNQFSGYVFAAREVYNIPVRGVMIEGIQIAKTFTRFERAISHRTSAQIDEWREGLEYWVGQAAQFTRANYWPMNERSCDKYGGCQFRPICSRDPAVRQRFLETDYEIEKWNPLKPRTDSGADLAEPEAEDADE
jgi:hypothetical protein